MPGTYRARTLREFDRNIFRAGMPSADRVLETVPYCWLCPATSGAQTREHVFARRLLQEFPPEQTQFHPIRRTSPLHGSVIGSRRGERPFPGTSLVAGKVCADCNNNWMSQLETEVRPFLTEHESAVSDDAVTLLARWFVKTAIVINVSQPYRLLWHQTRRHQVKTRVPDNVAVSLYRVPESDVNWMQGAPFSTMQHAVDIDAGVAANLFEDLSHLCRIQVGTLVGVVLAYPWQLSGSDMAMPGEILWSHRRGSDVDLSRLPLRDEPFGYEEQPRLTVLTSAFWSGSGRGGRVVMPFSNDGRSEASLGQLVGPALGQD